MDSLGGGLHCLNEGHNQEFILKGVFSPPLFSSFHFFLPSFHPFLFHFPFTMKQSPEIQPVFSGSAVNIQWLQM